MVQIQTRVLIGRNTFSVNAPAAMKVPVNRFPNRRSGNKTNLDQRRFRAVPGRAQSCLPLRDTFLPNAVRVCARNASVANVAVCMEAVSRVNFLLETAPIFGL